VSVKPSRPEHSYGAHTEVNPFVKVALATLAAVARILILEPQPEIRELVERVAERLGLEVLTDEPLDGETVDLVVLEPEGGDRLELATRLRSKEPKLPLIFASIAPPTAATRALDPHVHLLKPFTLKDLSDALSSAVPAS
jgi:CheY-like chemotaxis protein